MTVWGSVSGEQRDAYFVASEETTTDNGETYVQLVARVRVDTRAAAHSIASRLNQYDIDHPS